MKLTFTRENVRDSNINSMDAARAKDALRSAYTQLDSFYNETERLYAQRDGLVAACKTASNWLACSAITTPEDLMQSMTEILAELDDAIAKAEGGGE